MLFKSEIFIGLQSCQIVGFKGIQLLRRDLGEEVEFATMMKFDDLAAVWAFAGDDYEVAVVPPKARVLLATWQEGQVVAIDEAMHTLIFTIVLDALFSAEATGKTAMIQQAMQDLGQGLAAQSQTPVLIFLPEWFPWLVLRQKRRGARGLDQVVRHMIGERRALGERRGFEWLGPMVPNTTHKTTWRCTRSHEWQARYSSIQHGSGGRRCIKPHWGHPPADYQALALKWGLTWLGPEVRNVDTKTGWRCAQGHEWTAPYSSINTGRGCITCAGTRRKTPADYETLAAERGYTWLGPEVRNVMTKTSWRCDRGHEWQAAYRNLQQGYGCRYCARVGRPRGVVRD